MILEIIEKKKKNRENIFRDSWMNYKVEFDLYVGLIWFGFFNDISTFMGHLMPKPSLYNSKSKVISLSRGRPEGSLFNSYYTEV